MAKIWWKAPVSTNFSPFYVIYFVINVEKKFLKSIRSRHHIQTLGSGSTSGGSFSLNMLMMGPLKNLTPSSYNLLNIKSSEDHPYFFGLGMPSRFNCNHGFNHIPSKTGKDGEEGEISSNKKIKSSMMKSSGKFSLLKKRPLGMS